MDLSPEDFALVVRGLQECRGSAAASSEYRLIEEIEMHLKSPDAPWADLAGRSTEAYFADAIETLSESLATELTLLSDPTAESSIFLVLHCHGG